MWGLLRRRVKLDEGFPIPAPLGDSDAIRVGDWVMAVQELTPQLAEQLGLEPGTTGVVISDIESGSPTSEAGLRPGDLIKEMNRKGIENLDDYRQALNQAKKAIIFCF